MMQMNRRTLLAAVPATVAIASVPSVALGAQDVDGRARLLLARTAGEAFASLSWATPYPISMLWPSEAEHYGEDALAHAIDEGWARVIGYVGGRQPIYDLTSAGYWQGLKTFHAEPQMTFYSRRIWNAERNRIAGYTTVDENEIKFWKGESFDRGIVRHRLIAPTDATIMYRGDGGMLHGRWV